MTVFRYLRELFSRLEDNMLPAAAARRYNYGLSRGAWLPLNVIKRGSIIMRRKIIDLLKNGKAGEEVKIKGWVRTKRDAKNFSFIEVNDGSIITNIQVIADEKLPNYANEVRKIISGCSVAVEGVLSESPGKEQSVELQAKDIRVLGRVTEDYPLQKKRHSFEFLREIAHLRSRTNTFGAVFRVRHALSFAIHKFFNDRNFIYIHTPIISGSDCEGAGEMFRVSTLDFNDIPKSNDRVDFSQDFFEKPTFLTVSGQLEAELLALALGDVYTFGPTFRAENSNTARHVAEFWMIEPEMAFYDNVDNMELAEEFLKYIIQYVLDNCPDDMAFFNRWIEKGVIDKLNSVVKSDFVNVPYTDAIKILEQSKKNFEYPVFWGCDLQTEHERYLTEKHFKKPVTVYDYPKKIKAFYMRLNDDGKTVAAMDVLVPRIGEIIGGSQREERYDVLLRQIEDKGLNKEDYEWYLDVRRQGTVEHSGFGLGFARMLMFVTGMTNIRDVIPFPRTPGNAEF